MNHGIYRLVFNRERNAWLAVAENVRGQGKQKTRRRLAAVALGLAAGVAQAASIPPQLQVPKPYSGGDRPFVFAGAVNGGQPTTSMINGINTMTIDTSSRMLGLNWQKFDVGSSAAVIFNQPDSLSRVLNRIWDNDPSQIMGKLTANGQIYLINQNGILFGKDAQVNVGGLVASAVNLSENSINKLLTSGLPTNRGDSLEFAWDGTPSQFNKSYVIVDAGAKITTPSGGRVVLIAPKTAENSGLIETGAGGEAILAAGGKVILTAPDDPSLRGLLVETKSFTGTDSLGSTTTVDGSVTNNGTLNTGSGGVVSLAALAVNQKGIVNATKAVNINGTTMLVSGSGTSDTERLTINQRGSVAEIDWVSGLSVAAGQTLEFVQPSAGSVVYNYVYDPDRKAADGSTLNVAGRSVIDGVVKASGQFVLINEQGIDFGSNARVSANSFVASALGMNPGIVTTGLLGQIDISKRAFYLNASPSTNLYFKEGEAGVDQKRQSYLEAFLRARVNVAPGAVLESKENGYVILAGGQVNQGGTILAGRTTATTKDAAGNTVPVYKGGQVLLAAGADLYLKPGFSSAVRGFTAEVNPLIAIRTDRYERDVEGNIVYDINGDPKYVSDNNRWVAISRGNQYANRVVNTGYIGADLGNISVVGNEILQDGVLRTTTSATMNGSINLVARDMLNENGIGEPTVLNTFYRKYDTKGIVAATGTSVPSTETDTTVFIAGREGGTLTFGVGSTTQVAIDGSDGKTLTADQTFVKSSIEGLAKNVIVEAASLEAKGGRIQLRASDTFGEMTAFGVDAANPSQGDAPVGVGVRINRDASIDVSGTNASKKISDLFIEVELRGDEFANNPLQRNGKLRGRKAWVDIRDPVSIANLDGWTSAVGMTVEELAATGGTISLGSSGSVSVMNGSRLNVSGGTITYAAGKVSESRAVSASGQRYRLNDAPASGLYVGLATVKRDEAGYLEGKSAGRVEIVGRDLALDGDLSATTTVGTRQRVVGADPSKQRYAVPYGGELIIKDAAQHFTVTDRDTATELEKLAAYTKAQMVFVRGAANTVAKAEAKEAAAEAELQRTGTKPAVESTALELSQSLVDNGFSRFNITSDGRIDIPADVSLNLPAGGSFTASGRQIYVAGDVSAPSGTISLSTRDMSNAAGDFPTQVDARYSSLVVDSGASLSTAGRWVNDFLDGRTSNTAKAIKGGNINLSSAYDLDLRAGSSLDVSGGAWVDYLANLKTSGDAGKLTLVSGTGFPLAGNSDRIYLDGSLSGYALGKGGSLSISTSQINFGQPFSEDDRVWSTERRLAEGQVGAALDAGFVDQGGFFSFTFVGRTGLSVGDSVQLRPDPLSWSLARVSNYRYQPSGSSLAGFAETLLLHPELRSGKTSLSFSTTSPFVGTTPTGNLLIGENAYLGVSPKGSILLASAGQLTVLGTLEALSGTISLSRSAINESLRGAYTTQKQSESIYLGPNSKLLAGGTTILTAATRRALEAGQSPDSLLARQAYRGEVADGGSVSIDAGLGYVVTRAGSVIDVSGGTDTVNLPASSGFGVSYAAQTVGSAGGLVDLAAHAGMLLDGSYRAGGGKDALGGVFSLRLTATNSSDRNPWSLTDDVVGAERVAVLSDRQITLYQSTGSQVASWPASIDGEDYLVGDSLLDPVANQGKARVDAASLQAGGFGSWYLSSQDEIRFEGTVNATVNNQMSLNAPKFSAADDLTVVSLRAAAAQIGNSSLVRANSDATGLVVRQAEVGDATATIIAQDMGLLGVFSWSGFGTSRFVSSGAIHFDSVLNGAANRTGGRLYNGLMTATGDVTFAAARLSPATYSDFKVDLSADPDASIAITRPAGAFADVSLSPVGRLEFAAPTITHDGTVTAPLGEIVFSAPGGSVTLGADSFTSVAADRNLLFGYTTESGTGWEYNGVKVETLPAKSIVIDAAKTKLASSARLDLSGGGDAMAWEFTAGPGGKNDVLAAAAGTYAILPGWNGFSATDGDLQQGYLISTAGTVPSLKAGDRIQLGSNPYGLSGSYVLLPARYAVLPGAYLVTVKTGNDAVLGGALHQADGSWLVSGQRFAVNANGSTTAYGNSPLTLELAASGVVASRAKYVTTMASSFFYDKSRNLPGDAGLLAAVGRTSLEFDPAVVAMRQAEISAEDGRKRAGRGLELDLAAPRMVVSDGTAVPDASWSLVDQTKLNALGASSILLGGMRSSSGDLTNIETVASEVQVANTSTALTASELLMVASNNLTVKSGSRVASLGEAESREVVLSGDGAFLRVAESKQAAVQRKGSVSRLSGDVVVETNAVVAGRALYFDATRGNTLDGDIQPGMLQADGSRGSGGAVGIGAGRINVVGDNSLPVDGLTLSNADLARFASADEIRLNSYSTLDLYGNAVLGTSSLKALIISAAGIAGYGDANNSAKITAKQVVFENQNPDSALFTAVSGLGSGALGVSAETVEFGKNSSATMRKDETAGFSVGGFDRVDIAAVGDLRFSGVGVTKLDNAAGSGNATALNIDAGRVVTVDTADHVLIASGKTSVVGGKGASADTGLGGSLELRAAALDVAGRIETPAGKLLLRATGSDGVTIRNGATIAADGRKVAFSDTFAYAPGGDITLQADIGDVRVEDGGRVSVTADAAGGDAGALTLKAESGSVTAGKGTLFASANAAAGGGDLTVDAKSLNLDELADAVVNGGTRQFTGSWNIRRRDPNDGSRGDLVLNKRIVAADVAIATDKGGIDIGTLGEIDASGAKGGRIGLYTRDGDVRLQGKLIARGEEFVEDADNAGTRGQGGTVILGASGTGKVMTEQGSLIDVDVAIRQIDTGTEKSVAQGGKVVVRAATDFSQPDWVDNVGIRLDGGVVGASDLGAEIYYSLIGNSLRTGNSNTGSGIVGLDGTSSSIKKTLTDNFTTANMATLRSQLGFTTALQHVRPSVEIETPSGSVSDFSVDSNLDFRTLRFAGEAGVLTIRASGDLKVNRSLSDGFASTARDARLSTSGQSWSYRLVAGADQSAANPLAVVALPPVTDTDPLNGLGGLELAENTLIRTGTGSLEIAARKNILLNNRSAIYSAGIADASVITGFRAAVAPQVGTAAYASGGGDISLNAGEGIEMITASPEGRHINQWLYRMDNRTNNTQWWSQIGSFQEGVAAFGGGDISVTAGKSITNLTVAIPTSGRVPRINGVDQADDAIVWGGGDIAIRTPGEVSGGLYYAETGTLGIDAGSLKSMVGVALGNTKAEIVSRGDVELGNVFNPLWVRTAPVVTGGGGNSGAAVGQNAPRIGTYGNATELDVVSIGGDVSLSQNAAFFGVTDEETGFLMPSRVKVAALNGDISGGVAQAPGEAGQLDLLARGSIDLSGHTIRQLDVPNSRLPSLRNPIQITGANGVTSFSLLSLATSSIAREKHAETLWHAKDFESSRLIALEGDITAEKLQGSHSIFNESLQVKAGGDISNFNVEIQHAHASDVSSIVAGGDIVFDYVTSSRPGEKTEVIQPALGVRVTGPGAVELLAGKSIDLADSEGIVTRGNLENPYLPEGGASILAAAGATPDYQALRTYLGLGAELGEAELRDRFYSKLRDLGKQAQSTGDKSFYEQGRQLVAAFFPPDKVGKGDIKLSVSQIKSEQDGDIHLLAPSGSIVVGVADPSLTKKSSQQGVFTVDAGNIYAYVSDNFLVNQSRVFSLNGGEIIIWSNHGDIDAGSGSKTAVSTPPPALVIRNGQLVLDTSNSVSGSGIAVLKSRDDTPAANMSLFAPDGTIDAGDAGLRSTGDITLGARVVLNANNIQAGGAVTGAPVAVAAAAPVAVISTPTNTENKAVEETAAAAGKKGGAGGILTVEVLDGEPVAEAPVTKKEDERKGKSR